MINKIIIENTLCYLELKEIENLRLVSKKFKDVIDKSSFIWNNLIRRDFNISCGNSRTHYKEIKYSKLISKVKFDLNIIKCYDMTNLIFPKYTKKEFNIYLSLIHKKYATEDNMMTENGLEESCEHPFFDDLGIFLCITKNPDFLKIIIDKYKNSDYKYNMFNEFIIGCNRLYKMKEYRDIFDNYSLSYHKNIDKRTIDKYGLIHNIKYPTFDFYISRYNVFSRMLKNFRNYIINILNHCNILGKIEYFSECSLTSKELRKTLKEYYDEDIIKYEEMKKIEKEVLKIWEKQSKSYYTR